MTDQVAVEPIELEINVPVDVVTAWVAVTDPVEVARWFADVTPIDGIGSPYGIDFGDGSAVEGRIRALEVGHKVAYTWTWADDPASPTTLVTWTVDSAEGGGSRIRLVHDGWTEAGADPDTRDDHAGYWEGYLDDLRDLLETGADGAVEEGSRPSEPHHPATGLHD